MRDIVLQAENRTIIGKHVKTLRRNGQLPAIVYGHHLAPMPITLDARLARVLRGLNPSVLVTIELAGEKHLALVRDKQFDVLRGNIIHVDFQAVSMTETIRTLVSIELVGEAPAVADYNAYIVTDTEEVEVEALPQYLPERIVIDISVLKKIGDTITVADLPAIENVEILSDPEATLVVATSGTSEEEVKEEEEAFGGEEPAVIEKGKKEELDF